MSEDIAAKLDRLTSSWSSVGETCGQNTKELGEFLPQVRKGGEVGAVIYGIFDKNGNVLRA